MFAEFKMRSLEIVREMRGKKPMADPASNQKITPDLKTHEAVGSVPLADQVTYQLIALLERFAPEERKTLISEALRYLEARDESVR